ncbi:hypothetical protein [Desulfomarina sp.]
MDWQNFIVFGSLAGGGLVFYGACQDRKAVKLLGIALQLAVGLLFLKSSWYPVRAMIFFNSYFFQCFLLSLSAWFSLFFLQKKRRLRSGVNRYLEVFLLFMALGWWYVAGLREIHMQMFPWNFANGLLLYSAAGAIGFGLVSEKLKWKSPEVVALFHLPLLMFLGVVAFSELPAGSHLFSGWGWLAWGVAFYTQYRIIFSLGKKWGKLLLTAYHLGTGGLLTAIIIHELIYFLV